MCICFDVYRQTQQLIYVLWSYMLLPLLRLQSGIEHITLSNLHCFDVNLLYGEAS